MGADHSRGYLMESVVAGTARNPEQISNYSFFETRVARVENE